MVLFETTDQMVELAAVEGKEHNYCSLKPFPVFVGNEEAAEADTQLDYMVDEIQRQERNLH